MTEPTSPPLEETVVIVGVGLIGGSLAAALRQRHAARHVIGVGRDAARMKQAMQAGLLDEATTDLVQAARRADVMVFCTPVDRVAEGVRLALPQVRDGVLLTDAGSVKGPICEALADVGAFIGAHPIAGSHRQGFEAADPRLYEGRLCVVTPQSGADSGQVARLERFWQGVGMRTARMSPDAHDRTLAMTSHLPHVVAAALATTLTDENKEFTGTGFRDTSRVAAGSPDLWTGILLENSKEVIGGIDEIQNWLTQYRKALAVSDATRIRELLADGQRRRASLDAQPSTPLTE